jgi:hypothetical protein
MNRGVFVAALVSLCCAAEVQGQAASGSPPASEYEALVRDGADEFGRGNFVEARALFEQAHAKQPSARTLRGLGLCAYELKRYRQAITELEAALTEQHKSLTDVQRVEVRTAIDKARRYVGTLRLELEPPDATLLVDGRPTTASGELELDAGDYALTASAPGYKSGEQRVSVGGGQQLTARIVLTPLESLEPGPTRGTQRDASTEPGGHDEAAGAGPWPWVVTGISGAVMIGGGVLLALAMGDVSTVEDAKKGTPFSELEPAYDGAPIKSGVGFAMLGVGAAGVAVGLIWALGSGGEEAPVQVALGPDCVVLGGRL